MEDLLLLEVWTVKMDRGVDGSRTTPGLLRDSRHTLSARGVEHRRH